MAFFPVFIPMDTRRECSNCHKLNDEHATRCWNCGADFTKIPPPEPLTAKEKKLFNISFAAPIIAIMILVVGVIMIMVAMSANLNLADFIFPVIGIGASVVFVVGLLAWFSAYTSTGEKRQ